MSVPGQPTLSHPVLVVEDNPGDAELLREYLDVTFSKLPGNAIVVPSVAKAVRVLEQMTISAVILDLSLPDSVGVASVESIRSVTGTTPIIVVTGSSNESMALSCLTVGAQDYIYKDELTASTLRRSIQYAFARMREAHEQLHQVRGVERLVIGAMGGQIAICKQCKHIRDGAIWYPLDQYIAGHGDGRVSYATCPACQEGERRHWMNDK